MKVGIIDVGGGYRGIYVAGILDYCLDEGITFDLGIGVSAGSCNLLSFLGHQRGRNYKFYTEYGLRKEYAGMHNFLKKHSFIDLDYVEALSCSDGEYPLDYQAIMENPMELCIVATNAKTARPTYFSKTHIGQDRYEVMKASCALPAVCHPYSVYGVDYFDGAISDPIPLKKAFSMGCDRVILLLTRPENVPRTATRDEKLSHFIRSQYPKAAEQLCLHAAQYNEGVALAREYAKEGKVLIISPDDTCGVSTLTREQEPLRALYQKGYNDGHKIKEYLQM